MTSMGLVLFRRAVQRASRSTALILATLLAAGAACTATVTEGDSEGGMTGSGGSVGSGGRAANPNGPKFFEGGFAGRPTFPVASTGTGGEGGGPTDPPCRKPGGTPLPARKAVMDESAAASARPVFTRDVFSQFQAQCGGCHVDTSLGGFDDKKVTFENFAELVTQEAVDLMQSDDPEEFMPKPVAGGKAWSARPEGDPIRTFAALLQAWLDAGSPADIFFLEPEAGGGETNYLMTPEEGESLTNIGSCLPSRQVFASDESTMKELDDAFAKMTHLPEKLSQTDLRTWNGLEQARVGLFAVAPTYPLWSDGSGKLRQVRLPYGESMKFNSENYEFDVPDNTRVYKTFFKKVIEKDGREAHRKIETRLIVARTDRCEGEQCQVQALFGTYVWNDEETEAYLLRDPLRDRTEFADRIATYITDEAKAEAAGTNAVELAKATRHYALPGAERCIQCHQGSTTRNFLGGISPVQLNRVPYVKEPNELAPGDELVGDGVLEDEVPTEDELAQFDRLLDLGVVTGIESSALVPRLKELGTEPPRNELELRAQGYMLGNCGLCHNPLGYPSVKLPELRDLLDLYPRKGEGGIYHFPLERTSPRVKRGVSSDIDVPYITTSIYDRPDGSITPTDDPLAVSFRSKCMPRLDGSTEPSCVAAPWRSLIYRNVETPFTTADDYAIYPHMPRHTAGFDCRAPRIMAEWMLAIPSMLKNDSKGQRIENEEFTQIIGMYQPRVEVDMMDPLRIADQLVARHDVKQNLALYRTGERYSFCPDTSDILDPEVLSGAATAPLDKGQMVKDMPFAPWYDGVPDRAHFVALDHTDLVGDWNPRRPDWAGALLKEDPAKYAAMGEAEKRAVDLLAQEDLFISEAFGEYALTPQALGTWKADPTGTCRGQYAGMKTLASLSPEDKPYWADKADPNLPLYEISPGAAVFGQICRNCHGPTANGDSALADTIFDISGGTRVANLRDGLFGPASSPGEGAANIFGEKAVELGVSSDELSARYLLWMALGGTEVQIPVAALKIVQNAKFLGLARSGANLPSANMLSNAEEICRATLPAGRLSEPPLGQTPEAFYTDSKPTLAFSLSGGMIMSSWGVSGTPMITRNGDAQLWVELCAKRQKSPVRGLRMDTDSDSQFDTELEFDPPTLGDEAVLVQGTADLDTMYRLYDPEAYSTNPVMTPSGVRDGVPVGESQVWCLERAVTPSGQARQDEWAQTNTIGGKPYPLCPEGVRTWNLEDQRKFTTRGAMSAGLAVFTYLRAIARNEVTPPLGYDECHKLPEP